MNHISDFLSSSAICLKLIPNLLLNLHTTLLQTASILSSSHLLAFPFPQLKLVISKQVCCANYMALLHQGLPDLTAVIRQYFC